MKNAGRSTSARRGARWPCIALLFVDLACAQPVVNTTASKQTLEEASRTDCDGVSVIVQRCGAAADNAAAAAAKKPDDALAKSRANAKAAFDRRDRRSRDAALKGGDASDAPISGAAAQRLGAVTVTGDRADNPPSVEEVFQRTLNPASKAVPGPNGTESYYGLDGMRYDCVAKCVGPMCCVSVRSMPDPAHSGVVGH